MFTKCIFYWEIRYFWVSVSSFSQWVSHEGRKSLNDILFDLEKLQKLVFPELLGHFRWRCHFSVLEVLFWKHTTLTVRQIHFYCESFVLYCPARKCFCVYRSILLIQLQPLQTCYFVPGQLTFKCHSGHVIKMVHQERVNLSHSFKAGAVIWYETFSSLKKINGSEFPWPKNTPIFFLFCWPHF